ncbi:hypothetical protein CVT25_001140 [Psilocybe cyanescens]|uniref:Major facilitator superfamily (MFS) profile domain-containing protein n=1 Tax=Psilocybe cyanescens TaxID=93625 RepID=A0A409XB40_PSICY|nr:hypothetical protein CVT25_001140 [Psilocybe cyanescens]
MSDTFRDSTVGVFINTLSRGRYLRYPDQRPGWTVPENLLVKSISSSATATVISEKRNSTIPKSSPSHEDIIEGSETPERLPEDELPLPESDRTSLSSAEKGGKEGYRVKVDMVREETIQDARSGATIVDWYDEHDQDNPKNWSLNKRLFVLALISLLTFSVYIGSAIYTPSIPGIMQRFDVSRTTATLGLSLYVIGYGVGPLIFSPLSEIPSIGRTPIYMATLLIFALLQLPTIFAPNIHTLLAMRFFAGFFGSPALATGGASIQDMFPMVKLPYALISWSMAALCGPVLGPTIGGFAAMNKTWKWPIWELFWISSAAFSVLVFWLPETYAETILLKRARRLRALTGNPNLFSESEIKQSQMKTSEVLFEALLRPIQLMFEPAVLYANIYIGLAYAIFYLWFEAFPLVYNDIYHFNLGLSGLPFLGLMVSGVITSLGYIAWNYYRVEPEYRRTGKIVPESRLGVALFASAFIPLSLFMFGWTSKASIHWIVPTIGAALYLPGLFLLFQSVLVYLPSSYPKHAASILAGNDLFRSTVAGCFPLFGTPLYHRLTIGGGCSMLAGISIALIPGLWILYKWYNTLRRFPKRHSKPIFAMTDIFRDSTVGLIINSLSKGRLLPFADQRRGWLPPAHFQSPPTSSISSDETTIKRPENILAETVPTVAAPDEVMVVDRNSRDLPLPPIPLLPSRKSDSVVIEVVSESVLEKNFDPNLVTWYNDNDQDNPQHWSLGKRILVLIWISLLTFSIYIGSAIYTPSIPGVTEHFDVSLTTATLGLSLYVIGYGIGPIIFSPLSELPSVGRTPVYMATLFVFAILQIPTIYAPNIHTLLAMRFWAGFVGSPALATGGASIQDMCVTSTIYPKNTHFRCAAVCGPVLGPVIGGFAAQNKNWRWPLFELLWMSSFTFLVLVFWLPETNAETILLKRARRLRALTGNPNIYSDSELKQAHMTGSDVVFETLLRPFQLMMEPAVFYVNVYLALAYAIFYLWFEAFPLVYDGIYHFKLGQSGLPFIGLIVTCILTSIGFNGTRVAHWGVTRGICIYTNIPFYV